MAVSNKQIQLTGLARKLVLDGILDEDTAGQAFQSALKQKQPFVSYLVEKKLTTGNKIAMAAAKEFGVPLIDIESMEIDPEITKQVKENLIKKHHALPIFKRGKRMFIAVSDPTNLLALDEIKFAVGMGTEPVLVEEEKLQRAIDKALDDADSTALDMGDDDLEDLDNLDTVAEEAPDAADESDIDDALEPYEKVFRVRFRLDGVLEEVTKPPLALAQKIASRIKVMSRLDVSERRVPQDGRIKLKVSKNKAIDFRVSTCPTLYGEKAVMRILNSDAASLQIDQLGYEEFQKKLFLENLYKPYGMFLVTGPTGSGKTVSLYTGINLLNKNDVNISTAEDPVEINLSGVNQVQVDEKTGMTFAKALKAFLRQDPDIILVGEIRDLETGSIAVKAAQTGHMVMSTLHTNDGPQTLTRLQDMGIQAFAVATSINLIMAQRLCRRLHPDYKEKIDMPREALLDEGFPKKWVDKGFTVYGAVEGNNDCPSGYKGRTGIYQVMPISDKMKRLIIEGANAVQLSDQAASEGVWDIRTSGLKKVFDGITSLAELNRVTLE